jgi:hypothetical protein
MQCFLPIHVPALPSSTSACGVRQFEPVLCSIVLPAASDDFVPTLICKVTGPFPARVRESGSMRTWWVPVISPCGSIDSIGAPTTLNGHQASHLLDG